jgi:ferredoxin
MLKLAFYTAGAILPISAVVVMVFNIVLKKSSQAMLCTECQLCRAACPLLSRGCNPVDIMLAAKTGMGAASLDGTRLCIMCGKCREQCPRGLAPYLEVEKCREPLNQNSA